jgi:RNA polymerase sigma-70 factor (ECF subfamily)
MTTPPLTTRDEAAPAAGGPRAVRVASLENQPDSLAEEHRLVARAQQGDRPAFAALVERYWSRLYRWLYRLTRDRHAAEDLAQETFLKALGALNRFRPESNFPAWLFRIAHNAFANQCRSTRRREPLPDDLPGRDERPDEQAESREAEQRLAQAVSRLPIELRSVLLLRAEGGLSFRQIAEALELTEETARWRVFKARQRLLELVAPRPELEKP